MKIDNKNSENGKCTIKIVNNWKFIIKLLKWKIEKKLWRKENRQTKWWWKRDQQNTEMVYTN